jgi:hypothetical protein
MEAVRTSETSVDNHFTRQYNPEDTLNMKTVRLTQTTPKNYKILFRKVGTGMSKNYTTESLNKLQIKCYLGQRTKRKVLIPTLQRLSPRVSKKHNTASIPNEGS